MSRCKGIRRFLLVVPLLCLSSIVSADWDLEWDVRVEDPELREELKGFLEQFSQMFADAGFPPPYITDEACNVQTQVVIEDGSGKPLGQNCWGHDFYHCRTYRPSDACVSSSLRVMSEDYTILDYEERALGIGHSLFSSIMYNYEWYREKKPITDEDWLTWALPVAAAYWVLELTDERITDDARDFRSPLHAPLGFTRSQLDQAPDGWEGYGSWTWPIWTMIQDLRPDLGDAYEWHTILSGALQDRWSYKDNHLFYLDLLDAGLHQILVEACADDKQLIAVGGRDTCAGLCGAEQPLRIRYLDVEDDHPVEDYQVCADAVGGLYFLYPMMGSLLVDNIVYKNPDELEDMFPNWPEGRNYPSGCIPVQMNREDFASGRSYGEIELSLQPVSMECIVVSGQSARPGPAIHVTSESEEVIDQLHLAYDACGRQKLVTKSGENGPWTASWMMDPAASSPGCDEPGDEKYLVLANVAKRASETVAAEGLTVKVYGARGEVN